MTLKQIGETLRTTPGLAGAWIQQTEGFEAYDAVKQGGGAEPIQGIRDVCGFRVYLNTGTKAAEGSGPRAGVALAEAFEKIGLPLPAVFIPPAPKPADQEGAKAE